MEDGRDLTIHLMGSFHITARHREAAGLDQARVQRLLVYLLLHRRAPRSRQQIAFTLWPDTPDEQALTNLRTLLTRLRQALPDAGRFLDIGTHALRWRQDAPYSLDVADFEDACALAAVAVQRSQPAEAIQALERAVSLYIGDLLPGWYDEWLAPERERLRQAYLDALVQLAALLEESHDYRQALGYAQRLVRADPLHEAVYRQLMALHLALGDRASALRVYHTCATILRHELGVDPSPVTQAVYQRVLMSDADPPKRPPELASSSPAARGAALVGRQVEWQTLLHTWRRSAAGHVQVALLSGEAGIGKTRLAEELLAWAERQGVETAAARCYASGGPAVAYGPVVEWLRSSAVQARIRWLDGIWRSEVARLLPEQLSTHPDLPAPGPMTESWQRQRFFQALVRAVLGNDARSSSPLLLLLDDVQWCDQETLDWLGYLVRFDLSAPLLIVSTWRQHDVAEGHPLAAFRLTLARSGLLTEISLAPLNKVETAALAAGAARRDLTPDQVEAIYRSTEGSPLHIVEMMRAHVGAETTDATRRSWDPLASDSAALPQKVQAVIQYRLSTLTTDAQILAQSAAAVGREFTYDILALVTAWDSDGLARALDELWQRQIVREQGAQGYDFSHDTIRAVAYAQIGIARRQLLHRRIAEALLRIHEHDLDAASAQIASHLERTDHPAVAHLWHVQAGRHAQITHAPETAAWHYRRALALAPSDADALHPLYERLGEVERIQAHFPQAQEAYEHMRRAAEKAGNLAAQVKAWIGRAQLQDSAADYLGSLDSARRAERLASMIGAPAQAEQAVALSLQGLACYRLGQVEAALRLGEAALAASDALGMEGRWQKARSLNLLGAIHTLLGNHERAWADREQALRLFREVGDHVWIGHLLNNLGEVARQRGDFPAALPYYQEALAVAERIGNLEGEAVYRCNLGGTLVRLGHYEAAAAELRKALAISATGYWLSEAHSFLAEALLRQGLADDALHSGLQALELGRQTNAGEPLGIAWRVLGMIVARRGEPATIDDMICDAVFCFSQSAQILAEIGAEPERLRTQVEWANYT
ncbi:MAG TPA: tetratricopeptide repeat protein, partial [Anaerolineae bacterium]|nr:tetratricopeptide repeat protein [Anaerolineae bacterium]